MQVDDGVHELHDQHRLAHPGATEEAGLAAAREGAEQVDDLDAGGQQVADPGHLRQGYRRGDDGPEALRRQGRAAIQGPAEAIQQPSQAGRGHRDRQRSPGVEHRHAPPQAPGAMQGDGPDAVLVQMAVDLEGVTLLAHEDIQRPVQGRETGAADVDDRAMHLLDEAQGGVRQRAGR